MARSLALYRPGRHATVMSPYSSMALTRRAGVDTLELENRRLKSRLEKVVVAADQELQALIGDLAVVAGGGVAGVLQGMRGGDGIEIVGIPGEVAAGVALIGASMLGLAGKDSHYLRKMGAGALAATAATFMRGLMIEREAKKAESP